MSRPAGLRKPALTFLGDHADFGAGNGRDQRLRAHREDRVRRAAGAPHGLEPSQGGVNHRAEGMVVAERRYSSNREAGRLPYLVAFGLAHLGAELLRVDAPIAGAQTEQWRPVVDEHEGLDDLAHLDANRVRRLLRCPGRVGELPHLGIEAELAESILESLG
jgi:hypothetical protein